MNFIFSLPFMQRALIVAILLAVIIPCIGMIVVLKRLSMTGDALSHTSLAGVVAGLVWNINPILSATLFCIAAALGMELIRKKFPKYSEISVSIILAAGVGLAAVLSTFVKSSVNIDSFLFGSILTITDFELYMTVGLSVIVLLTFVVLYKELFYITMNERDAVLSGVPVRAVNLIFTLLTAVTVALAARTVGALIVSSMMVLPVASAMQFEKGYKVTLILSVLFGAVFMVSGLIVAFYLGLKTGGTIILIGVIVLIVILVVKSVMQSLRRLKR